MKNKIDLGIRMKTSEIFQRLFESDLIDSELGIIELLEEILLALDSNNFLIVMF